MKLRAPRRFASAVTRIKNALGDDKCAEIVGRSSSLIRKWSDPDHPSRPNLKQALVLDVAYMEAGHGVPPILSMYQQRLARAVTIESKKPAVDVALAALSVQAAVGDISESILSIKAGSADGVTFSSNERNQILGLLEKLMTQVSMIEETLDDNPTDLG